MRSLAVFAFVMMTLGASASPLDAGVTYNRAAEMIGALHRAGPGCVTANVRAFDPVNKWQSGTVEYCWAVWPPAGEESSDQARSGAALKTTIDMPNLHATFLQRGKERVRWGDEGTMHFALAIAFGDLFGTGSEEAGTGVKLFSKAAWLGNEALQCASRDQSIFYCANSRNPVLRSLLVPGGEMQIVIESVENAAQRPYVRKARVVYFGRPIAEMDVTGVRQLDSSEVARTFTPAASARSDSFDRTAKVDGQIFRPSDIGADHERMARATLTVGTDGRAKNVHVLAASDVYFAEETQKALLRAHYLPAVRNGLPVEAIVSAAIHMAKAPTVHGVDFPRDPSPETYLQSWQYASDALQR